MKLLALHCGDLATDIGGLLTGTPNGTIGNVPVMTFAIDTGDGVLVFDTGVHEACCGPDPAAHFGSLLQFFEIRCPREALVDERLKQAGYQPDDIRWITNSHLHFDHAGRYDAWGGATQLVRASEFAYASARVSRPSGFLAGDLAGISASDWDYDDTFDVLGDGSLVLISTPGHTPAHQALLVTFVDHRRFALTGDASYTLAGIQNTAPTGRVWNHEAAVSSLSRLRALSRDGVELLTAHDLSQWSGVDDITEMHSA
jgi:glyoxylase-like metal-dependent hydrolase (beta-lactamase superfamily II)